MAFRKWLHKKQAERCSSATSHRRPHSAHHASALNPTLRDRLHAVPRPSSLPAIREPMSRHARQRHHQPHRGLEDQRPLRRQHEGRVSVGRLFGDIVHATSFSLRCGSRSAGSARCVGRDRIPSVLDGRTSPNVHDRLGARHHVPHPRPRRLGPVRQHHREPLLRDQVFQEGDGSPDLQGAASLGAVQHHRRKGQALDRRADASRLNEALAAIMKAASYDTALFKPVSCPIRIFF